MDHLHTYRQWLDNLYGSPQLHFHFDTMVEQVFVVEELG